MDEMGNIRDASQVDGDQSAAGFEDAQRELDQFNEQIDPAIVQRTNDVIYTMTANGNANPTAPKTSTLILAAIALYFLFK